MTLAVFSVAMLIGSIWAVKITCCTMLVNQGHLNAVPTLLTCTIREKQADRKSLESKRFYAHAL